MVLKFSLGALLAPYHVMVKFLFSNRGLKASIVSISSRRRKMIVNVSVLMSFMVARPMPLMIGSVGVDVFMN